MLQRVLSVYEWPHFDRRPHTGRLIQSTSDPSLIKIAAAAAATGHAPPSAAAASQGAWPVRFLPHSPAILPWKGSAICCFVITRTWNGSPAPPPPASPLYHLTPAFVAGAVSLLLFSLVLLLSLVRFYFYFALTESHSGRSNNGRRRTVAFISNKSLHLTNENLKRNRVFFCCCSSRGSVMNKQHRWVLPSLTEFYCFPMDL